MKKVPIAAKPQAARKPVDVDEWVNQPRSEDNGRVTEAEAMKRLTIDVPAHLHAQIKSKCALQSVKMADAIRELLEQHFTD